MVCPYFYRAYYSTDYRYSVDYVAKEIIKSIVAEDKEVIGNDNVFFREGCAKIIAGYVVYKGYLRGDVKKR